MTDIRTTIIISQNNDLQTFLNQVLYTRITRRECRGPVAGR